jgi:hypothetical protein
MIINTLINYNYIVYKIKVYKECKYTHQQINLKEKSKYKNLERKFDYLSVNSENKSM